MKPHLTLLLAICFLVPVRLFGQNVVNLNVDSGSKTLFNSNDLTALSGGNSVIDGDGDVFQIGYYTGASSSSLFSGTWVPLTGNGGANSAFSTTSIGDMSSRGAGNGTFAFSLTFAQGSSVSGASLPNAGQILSFRFYNGTTLANSSYYGAVSDASWVWVTPAPATSAQSLNYSLDNSGVSYLNNDVAYTGVSLNNTNAAPEPTTLAEVILGICALGFFRRKLPRLVRVK